MTKLQELLEHIDKAEAGPELSTWLIRLRQLREAVSAEAAPWKEVVAEIVRQVYVSDWDVCLHCSRHRREHRWQCAAGHQIEGEIGVVTSNHYYPTCPKCEPPPEGPALMYANCPKIVFPAGAHYTPSATTFYPRARG